MTAAKRRVVIHERAGAMFSNLWSVTGFLRWAEKQSVTPVIDLSAAANRWVGPGANDAWGLYFRPVSDVDVTEIDRSEAEVFDGRPREFPTGEYSREPEYVRVFHQYIGFNLKTTAYIIPWEESLALYPKVLGVHFRGTDMKVAKSHWAPPTPFQIKHAVDIALDRSDFTHILVATEDERALQFMVRRYRHRVITTDSLRTSKPKKLVHLSSNIPQYRYFLGLQVLRDAQLLAGCAGLVSGHSNVSEHVQVMARDPFEVNLQIRRPRVDIAGSHPAQIALTNLLRNATTSKVLGPDFRLVDFSAS
ncbi:MAG: hypothetical protein QNL06_06400 [Pontimonas sp.]